MGRLGAEISRKLFDPVVVENVEKWHETRTGPYQTFVMEKSAAEERLVFIGMYRRKEPGAEHGYLLIISPSDHAKISDFRVSPTEPIPVLRYHICKDKDGYYLRPDNVKIKVQSLRKDELHPIATTKLTDRQLDALALFCVFQTYQLIRQDCLAFAKRMAEEIGRNENGKTVDEIRDTLRTLTVFDEDHKSAQSEGKSRRYPDAPKGYSVALLGAVIFEPAKYLTYPVLAALVSGFVFLAYRWLF